MVNKTRLTRQVARLRQCFKAGGLDDGGDLLRAKLVVLTGDKADDPKYPCWTLTKKGLDLLMNDDPFFTFYTVQSFKRRN